MAATKKRNVYKPEFKAKVALEAVRGKLTINQISKQFGVHPNQISKWKKQFLENLPQIFDNSKQPSAEAGEELTNQLYQQIGQLKVELDWLKNLPLSVRVRRELVEPENEKISVARQCELLGLNRTGLYYRSRTESVEDGNLMRLIDEQYTLTPFYGYRRMTVYLQKSGFRVNHKRVRRLMRKLGLEAIYPKPNLSKPGKDHLTYPYLLRGVAVEYSDQVWACDITYLRLGSGFVYLLVIMDWHSRFVIEMEVSNSLESSPFVEALKRALAKSKPEIFNSDQGSQFTSVEWLKVLQENKIRISMDGRGRCFNNIFVERLWRSVKQEEVYLKEYADVWEAEESLRQYFEFYNYQRPHQSLNYQTPFEAYQKGRKTEENIKEQNRQF